MAAIKREPAEDRMRRSLLVIEGLTLEDADAYTKEELCKIMSDIYCVAHAATCLCCAGGESQSFFEIQERLEKFLKEANIMDVAETMKQKPRY